MLAGTDRERTPAEARVAGKALRQQASHAVALRLYTEAFAAAPTSGDNPRLGHRYGAARAAVRTGAEHYAQALAWLRADLTAWKAQLDKQPGRVAQVLGQWLSEADLADVRDAEDVRAGWKALWSDVARFRKRAVHARGA